MKFCPQCNLEFEDETVFCPRDGSPLHARVAKAGVMKLGSRPASAGVLGVGALTGAPAVEGDTARPVPSMATLQAATVKAPPRAAQTPRPRVASEMQRTTPTPRAKEESYLDEATSVVALPGDEAPRNSDPSGALLDTPTVAMSASPVAALEHPTDPPPGDDHVDLSGRTIAGRYRLQRRLGEGGMGVVYAALDERIDKQIAIKVLREEFVRRQDVVARFTQEARSAGRIKHENVLDVTDYGRTEDNGFYIAMELLVGTDLAEVLTRERTVVPERGIDIAIQICRALAAAHREGVVHRDLKPENVFLVRSDDGREVVKIVDFGIAQLKDGAEGGRKLTRTGMIFGTPEYMSPEQAAGKPIDLRVDVYATGVILYEMFTGRVPFFGDTFMGVLTQHMFEAVPPMRQVNPECAANEDLESVILKALSKDPAQRYATMNELAEDLQRVRAGLRPNAPAGYEGTGTFLRAQMLQGARLTPGAISPSAVHGPPSQADGAGVSRTIEHELPPQRSRALLFAGLGVGVTLAAVGVVWALSQNNPPTATATPPPTAPRTAVPPEAPSVVPAPRPAPSPAPTPPLAAADAGAATVRVSVVTPGASAEIRFDGEAAPRCASTPCEITVPRGAELKLNARSGTRAASVTVTARQDGQVLTVTLPPERGGRPVRNGHAREVPTPTPPTATPPTNGHDTPSLRPRGARSCRSNSDCDCWLEQFGMPGAPCGS
ncbi:MAG: protein kinase [Polyangiales bacterium]